MKQKGSAMILIVLAIFGAGYFLSQNPQALAQIQDGLSIDLPQLTDPACQSLKDEISEKTSGTSERIQTTTRCTCTESVSDTKKIVVYDIQLEDAQSNESMDMTGAVYMNKAEETWTIGRGVSFNSVASFFSTQRTLREQMKNDAQVCENHFEN